ncbi:MAG: response regulator [Phycisphaerales bacterium]|jgi:CheY-like chemotaxis protein|nr:response regulator [Phycisphaerales bacterium]
MKERVMLVDDDPAVQRVVRDMLSDAGYDLSVVSSGWECIEHVCDGFKGLILMDIRMPELDGWETIAALVGQGLIRDASICMFSVVHDTVPGKPELERYLLGRLPKPFTRDELLGAVGQCLDCMRRRAIR